tara:strand:+ start:1208 stop:2146 length:939 start_codon:yes stop_codon:yes gene_type:complete
MKILVTGSSGFIGYHLIKKLLKDGHDVIGIDDHNDYYDIKLKELRNKILQSVNFSFFKQDINHLEIKDDDIDLAINLAAQPGVRVKKEIEYLYQHTNINGFQAFCNFCEHKKIKKIIYASSSSVYSDNHTKRFIESSTKLNPKSVYGLTKMMNELYADKFSKRTSTSMIGFRFFSVYGPYGRPDMAYFLFANSIRDKKTIYLNNKGEMSRDMTFVDDVIEGIKGGINYLNKNIQVINEIFNLGNDHPISTLDMLNSIESVLNKKTKIINLETNNEALITHADISKAKNLLGYTPRVTFKDGIKFFLDWHKSY